MTWVMLPKRSGVEVTVRLFALAWRAQQRRGERCADMARTIEAVRRGRMAHRKCRKTLVPSPRRTSTIGPVAVSWRYLIGHHLAQCAAAHPCAGLDTCKRLAAVARRSGKKRSRFADLIRGSGDFSSLGKKKTASGIPRSGSGIPGRRSFPSSSPSSLFCDLSTARYPPIAAPFARPSGRGRPGHVSHTPSTSSLLVLGFFSRSSTFAVLIGRRLIFAGHETERDRLGGLVVGKRREGWRKRNGGRFQILFVDGMGKASGEGDRQGEMDSLLVTE
ncbi:hypothetical protein Taro_029557 [Colocasia esculenta]|uniref:Uncharacterized protein n=1 Tax=Colocasia esculenta TaxID=4460 RepID=A0A843VPE2_COLES|nr:hypothetical protein [Colocasia esculenta]